MSATNINIRVSTEIKVQAQDIFSSLGIDMTTAINIFLRQAILQKGIPFALSTEFTKKIPKPGCMTGKIRMAKDFDEPLEDFKEYMQ
jgi:DNA-damage-inducible protein J